MRVQILSVVVLVALTGCPPSVLTNTCHFQGETTACGMCIQRACQPKIDAECASPIRDDDALAALDACANGQGCTKLTASVTTSDIGDCMKTYCLASCSTTAQPTEPLGCKASASGTCTCTVGAKVTSEACDEGGFACCKSSNWPSSGATCTCFPRGCLQSGVTSGECACAMFADVSNGTPVSRCTGETCCQTNSSCTCTADSYCANGTEVSSCTVDNIPSFCTNSADTPATSCQ